MIPTLLGLLPLLVPAPQESAPAEREVPAAAEVLREADRAFFRATRQRGLEGWLAAFAADAVVFPEAGDWIQGRDELRRHYTALQFPPAGFVWEPLQAGLSQAGDLGWTVGRWGNDAGGSASWAGRYLTVWRRSAAGAWEVVADCGGEPGFLDRVQGLRSPPVNLGRETQHVFLATGGDLSASVGVWWATDEAGNEVGGKSLSVWRRVADGTFERVAETGFAQARR